jgi:energy-coupling factor transporter ATP-binding protein EcfA2
MQDGVREERMTRKEYLERKWLTDVWAKSRAQAINLARQRELLEKQQSKAADKEFRKMRASKVAHIFDGLVESQGFGIPINHKLGSNTLEFLNTFKTQVLDCFNGHFGTAVSTFENIGNSIPETIGAMMSTMNRLIWFVPIFTGIVFLGIKGSLNLANILLTIMVALSPSIFGKVKDVIQDLFSRIDTSGHESQGEEVVESQSGVAINLDAVKNTIAAVTAATIGLKGAGKVVDMFTKGEHMDFNLLTAIKTASEGAYKANKVADFVRFSLEICENFVNYISRICGSDKKFSLFKSGQREVDTWVDNVNHIVNEYTVVDRKMNIDSIHLLRQLLEEGEHYHKMYKNNSSAGPLISRTLNLLRNVCTLNSASFSAVVNSRVKPEFVLFCGPSGAGKSFFMNHLAMQILARTLSKEKLDLLKNPEAGIYTPAQGDAYASSYVEQPIAVMDDAFMEKVLAGGPNNECAALVRMINGWSYELPMADLERKGKVFFRSICVLATTNTVNLMERAAVTVYNPEAVVRRVGHGYKVGVNKLFRKDCYQVDGMHFEHDALDVNKVDDYIARHGVIPEDAWCFYKHDYSVGKTSDECYTFREVVDMIVESVTRNQHIHQRLIDANRTIYERTIKERFGEVVEAQAFPIPFGLRHVVETNVGPEYLHALEKGLLSSNGVRMEHDDKYRVEVVKEYFGPVWNRKSTVISADIVQSIQDPDTGIEYDQRTGLSTDFTHEEFNVVKKTRELCSKVSQLTSQVRTVLHGAIFNENKFLDSNPILRYMLGGGALILLIKGVKAMAGMLVSTLFRKLEVEPQGPSYAEAIVLGTDSDTINAPPLYEKVAKNTFIVYWDVEKPFKVGHVLALTGRTILVPAHYYNIIETYIKLNPEASLSDLVFKNGMNPHLDMRIPPSEFLKYSKVELVNKDLCMVDVDVHLHVGSLLNKFLTKKDVWDLSNKTKRFESCLVSVGSIKTPQIKYRTSDTTRFQDRVNVNRNSSYSVLGSWRYSIATSNGDCGSPLVTGPRINHFGGRCILGFHTGALVSGDDAFSSSVTQEDIDQAKASLEGLIKRQVVDEVDPPEDLVESESVKLPLVFEGASWQPIFETNKRVNFSLKCGYTKSKCYEAWGPATKGPVDFNPIDKKLSGALMKYAGKVLWISRDKIKRAMHTAKRIISGPTVDCSRYILTKEEAVCGVQGNEYIGSVNRRSGAGWPHCEPKTKFFGVGDEFDLTNDQVKELFDRVDKKIELARQGTRDFQACQTILKREKLKLEKIAEGKIRAVFGTNLEYLICVRMYFGSFIAALMEKRFETGCCLGINPYKEWGTLKEGLHSVSKKIIAGDYKSFDANAQQAIYNEMIELINDWYDDGPENANIRRVLWMDLSHSRHIVGDSNQIGTVVQWFKSLPSGHPMTTTANNIYNMVLFIMCYNDLAPEQFQGQFEAHVKGFFFGDDNIVAVSDEASVFFNQMTLETAMEKYGMVYTTDSKDKAKQPTRILEECTFLKRGFLTDMMESMGMTAEYVYAPLDMSSILESPYWVATNSKSSAEASDGVLEANIENLLMELSAHPPSQWEAHFDNVASAARRILNYTTKYSTRGEYQAQFRKAESKWNF